MNLQLTFKSRCDIIYLTLDELEIGVAIPPAITPGSNQLRQEALHTSSLAVGAKHV